MVDYRHVRLACPVRGCGVSLMTILEQIPRTQEKSGADDSQVLQHSEIVERGWIYMAMLLTFYKTLKA